MLYMTSFSGWKCFANQLYFQISPFKVHGTPKVFPMISLHLLETSQHGNDCNDSELFVI